MQIGSVVWEEYLRTYIHGIWSMRLLLYGWRSIQTCLRQVFRTKLLL